MYNSFRGKYNFMYPLTKMPKSEFTKKCLM